MGANPAQSSGPSLPPPAPPKHKTGDKAEKADKQAKRPAMTPFHHRLSLTQDPCLEQDSSGGPQLGSLVALEPPLEPLPPMPNCKYPKPLSASRKAPDSLLHSPVSPLPPTLSPHPRGQDPEVSEPPVGIPPCPDGTAGLGVMEPSETALYAASLGQRERGSGWWRGFRTPRTDRVDLRMPELPVDRIGEGKMEPAIEGATLKR